MSVHKLVAAVCSVYFVVAVMMYVVTERQQQAGQDVRQDVVILRIRDMEFVNVSLCDHRGSRRRSFMEFMLGSSG